MKRFPVAFLQVVLVLIGTSALLLSLWLPSQEGRATNLDIISIYTDPFILYGYVVSIPFFIALYQAFRLLRYISRNEVFSMPAVNTLRNIKMCAAIFGGLVLIAGISIRLNHSPEDDPAGFIALCLIITFATLVIGTAAAIFEKLLRSAVEMKSENDLTI